MTSSIWLDFGADSDGGADAGFFEEFLGTRQNAKRDGSAGRHAIGQF